MGKISEEDKIEIIKLGFQLQAEGKVSLKKYYENTEDTRIVFKQLKDLSEKIKSKKYKEVDMKYLSMGMTNDYEIALEEGANIIRVGTGIFGNRKY